MVTTVPLHEAEMEDAMLYNHLDSTAYAVHEAKREDTDAMLHTTT